MLKKALDERFYSQIQNYNELTRKFLVEKTLDAFGQEIKSLPFILVNPNYKLHSFFCPLLVVVPTKRIREIQRDINFIKEIYL